MTESSPTHLNVELVARSNTDSPSYWWSALRYMQAYRTMSQMEPVAARLLGRIKSQTWPFVRGIRDEPHVGAFPICDDRNKWASKNIQRQLGGMSTEHSSWVEQVQPFNGVAWTRDLQELSNADKHRFGVEVSPTCQLRVNIVDTIPDPSANNVTLAQIENIGLHFRLPALTPYGEFSDVFNGMLVGAADLLNLFLDQAGIETIEIGAAWTVAPDSCT